MGPRLRHAKHRLSQRAVAWLMDYVFRPEFEGESPNVQFFGKACPVYALEGCTAAVLHNLLHGLLPDGDEPSGNSTRKKAQRRRQLRLRTKSGSIGAHELVVSVDKRHTELARRDPRWDVAITRVFGRMLRSVEDCVGIRTETRGKKIYIHTGKAVMVVAAHELSREHEPLKHWHIYVLNLTPRDDTALSYAVDPTAIAPNLSAILDLAKCDLIHEAREEGIAVDDEASVTAIDPAAMEPIATRRVQILAATKSLPSGTSEQVKAAARDLAWRSTRKAKELAKREDMAAAVNAKLRPETVAALDELAGRPEEVNVLTEGHATGSRIAALTAAVIAATPEDMPHLSRFSIAAAVCRAGRYSFHSRMALSEGAGIAVRQPDQPYPWCVSRLHSLESASTGPAKFNPEEFAQATRDVAEAAIDFDRIAWGSHRSARKLSKPKDAQHQQSTIVDYLRPTRRGRPKVPPTVQLSGGDATHATTSDANVTCREIARAGGFLDEKSSPALLSRLLGDKRSGVPALIPVGATLLLTSRDGSNSAGTAFGIDCVDGIVSLSALTPNWKPKGSGVCSIPPGLLPAEGDFLIFEDVVQSVAAGDRLTPLTRHRMTLKNGHRKSVYPHRSYIVTAIDTDVITLAGVGRVCRSDLPRWTRGWCMRPGIDARGARSVTNAELHDELELSRDCSTARPLAPEVQDCILPINKGHDRNEPCPVESSAEIVSASDQELPVRQPPLEANNQPVNFSTAPETSIEVETKATPSDAHPEIDRDIETECREILDADFEATGTQRPKVALSRADLIEVFVDVRHPDGAALHPAPEMQTASSRYHNIGCHAFAYYLQHVRDRGAIDPAETLYALWDLGIAFGASGTPNPNATPLGIATRDALMAALDVDIAKIAIGSSPEIN